MNFLWLPPTTGTHIIWAACGLICTILKERAFQSNFFSTLRITLLWKICPRRAQLCFDLKNLLPKFCLLILRHPVLLPVGKVLGFYRVHAISGEIKYKFSSPPLPPQHGSPEAEMGCTSPFTFALGASVELCLPVIEGFNRHTHGEGLPKLVLFYRRTSRRVAPCACVWMSPVTEYPSPCHSNRLWIWMKQTHRNETPFLVKQTVYPGWFKFGSSELLF